MDLDYQALRSQLLTDEGRRLAVYRYDGRLYVGVGHLLVPKDRLKPGVIITPERVEALLWADMQHAYTVCLRVFPDFQELPHEAQQVLTNVAFTTGEVKLRRFTSLRQAVARHAWKDAARALRASKWHRQVGSRARRLEGRLERLGG